MGTELLGGASLARHVAVEREADGVEDGRLPRAGVAAEQEDARLRERVEVDGHRVGEGPERRDLQGVQAHQARTTKSASGSWPQASHASSSSCDSAGPAGRPRTSRTKSRVISWSLRPAPVRAAGSRTAEAPS